MARVLLPIRAPEPQPPQVNLLAAALRGDPTPAPREPVVDVDIRAREQNDEGVEGQFDPPEYIAGNPPPELRQAGDDSTRWQGGFSWYPYSHAAAELRDPCDFTTVDLPALPTPATPTAVELGAASGTLAAGPYSYRVAALNGNGTTLASTGGTVTTLNALRGVRVTWNRVHGASSYKVYGRTAGSELLMATVADPTGGWDPATPTLTWTDDGSVTPAGALPGANTTAGPGGSGYYTNPGVKSFYPYLITVEDFCSAFGWQAHEYRRRASMLLDNATPNAMERELWTGGLTVLAGTGNNYLTNNASVTDLTPGSGPPSVKRGMQILEDALASCGFGGQGMIHAQPQTTPDLTGARRVGNRLYSVLDNLIIPGSGYPGTGPGGASPAAGTAWMYATDLVTCFVDPARDLTPDNIEEATDRDINDIRFRATRFGAAIFDAACHFGVRVTLAT